jgi:hypothetical protein
MYEIASQAHFQGSSQEWIYDKLLSLNKRDPTPRNFQSYLQESVEKGELITLHQCIRDWLRGGKDAGRVPGRMQIDVLALIKAHQDRIEKGLKELC